MEISKTRLLGFAIIPLAVLLLSGCGSQTGPKSSSTNKTDANTETQAKFNLPNPALQNDTAPVDALAADKAKLEPLPADNKQAIDAQLSSIDSDLKSTSGNNNSTDLSNADLGLGL